MISAPALAQEFLDRDLHFPWRIIVCCALLNQTSGKQVVPMLQELFRRCPGPEEMLYQDVSDLLRPLGFQNRRASLLRRMSGDYVSGVAPEKCYGVGPYARDALALFVDERIDIETSDHRLKQYLDWRKSEGINHTIGWDKEGHAKWLSAVRSKNIQQK